MASGKGGYDCDFVEDPPKRFECPICLQTVREPHVISCCGHQFCRLCIEQVRLQGKPCPLCNEPSYTLFLHKGVEREVKALRVRCPQKELGCEWVGELGGLERHVSPGAGPSASGRGEGCQYAEVECVYQCGERHQRRFVVLHETELCTRRPVEAQLTSVTRKLQEAREENTSLREAQVRMREQQMKQEEEMKKLSEKLDTIFNSLKAENNALREELCQAEGELSEVQQKLEEEQKTMRALSEGLEEEKKTTKALSKRLNEETRALSKKLDKETRALSEGLEEEKKTTTALSEKLREGIVQLNQQEKKHDLLESRLTLTPPYVFSIYNYEHLKKHDMGWFSDPFYSHPQGYKLCVVVYPGGCGNGKGTHMSVCVSVMRGEYDDSLEWPFLGSVAIQLFHRQTEMWKDVITIRFSMSDPLSRGRPSMDCTMNQGSGYSTVLSKTELENYMRNDIIRLRISNVDLNIR